ncbi:hypothetical protein [Phytoactinopolyspora halotolerans]|uniref:Uncharacterized protein n=1 Tax=Phytoactinopolyspora halotolerans TaxID=1981512 RepID=A0A6L9S272_9ACTN|nr:hypothetical protein [Phytoactinopolyspora halotolerans]NED99106.1 hypothetical protein [Phytoactinopolyspora halotolerans]
MTENPRRRDLEQLQQRVSNRIDDLKEALDGPRTIMEDGDAWTGSRADIFGEDLGYRRTDLQGAATTLSDDIDSAVQAEPETLPEDE